jgi:PncC family amidohydrolase
MTTTIDDPLRLATRIGERCHALGVRIATAESCTAGLVAHLLTEVAGSSAWFPGGVVAYANETKIALLGVPAALIAVHGAVSEPVACAMARGAMARLGADLAVAVTGIAGPGGGTATKPVGLAWVAVSGPGGEVARRYVWSGDRSANKRASAHAALELLLEQLVAW